MRSEPPQQGIEYHRRYFLGQGRTTRIALGLTPTVRRHVAQTIDSLGLAPGARVLELGCGLGRFTEALLDRGFHVTALDLSDYLIDLLRKNFKDSPRLDAVVGRAEDVAVIAPGPYDAVVGFFFLHHIPDLEPAFRAMSRVLAPGGWLAFCEPNAFNPLFYVQMTITPGMSWKGEPSVSKMRPGFVFPILKTLGFADMATSLYGVFPPRVSNTSIGGFIERGLERLPLPSPTSPYRILRARRPA
jgi:SAM-dependent methyltransferase